jgi:hypothetical protein
VIYTKKEQLIASIALVAQDKLTRGGKYNTPGIPNFQSILEGLAMSEDALELAVQDSPEIYAQFLRLQQGKL